MRQRAGVCSYIAPIVAAAALLSACDHGTLTLSVSDAPVDEAQQVVVQIDGVRLLRADGGRERFQFDPPRRIDLLALQSGRRAALLDEETVKAGEYTGLELQLSAGDLGGDSFIDLTTGERFPLQLTDDAVLGIDTPFRVRRLGEIALTVDFDLRQSVLPPESSADAFRLRPSMRLVRDDAVGTLSGRVADELIGDSECVPAVYVYQGRDAMPGDMGSVDAPFASGRVSFSFTLGANGYTVALLPPGDYTLALTCDALRDNPETDDDIAFGPVTSASVRVGRTTEVNF